MKEIVGLGDALWGELFIQYVCTLEIEGMVEK